MMKYFLRYFKTVNKTTIILVLSITIWAFIQLVFMDDMMISSDDLRNQNSAALKERLFLKRVQGRMTPGEIAQLRQQRMKEAKKALGSAAEHSSLFASAKSGFFGFFGRKNKKKHNVERLPEGCEAAAWHNASFPNCNDLHEIDLRDAFFKKRGSIRNESYVGHGLWRHVWKVNPHSEPEGNFILKMMKAEHDVDNRNIDRHRRDALVMERLTSSPYIVSMYGYCGNTVLTEYAGRDLDEVLYEGTEVNGRTRKTPEGRLRLALDMAKGIEALHTIEGGPIIHADITANQFLIDSGGNMKLNDFNRCRFVPHKNIGGADDGAQQQQCDIKIPSAPGNYRSPEEYEFRGLTAKIDVYSVAHLLFGVLTGTKAWESHKTSQIKKFITNGQKPPIPSEYYSKAADDTTGLAALVDLAYEVDPKRRISATEMVEEIQRLLNTQH